MSTPFAKVLLVLLLLLSPQIALAKGTIRSIEVIVTRVSDGDTINVQDHLGTKLKVRLYGIDAPETEKANKKTGRVSKLGQAYGSEAREALSHKVYRQRVKLDVMDVDRYKRLVSMVRLGTRNINREMVAEGWAWAYRDYLSSAYASEFIGHEQQARSNRAGLWRQTNPVPPWEFRGKFRVR